MGIIRLFKKEDHRWYRLDQFLKSAFSKVRDDTESIVLWMHHFKAKHEHNDYQHYHFDEELKYHKGLIFHLNKQIKELKNELENLKNEKGQLRTSHGTSQGQVKDMSFEKKDTQKTPKIIQKPLAVDKSMLAGSHLELVNLLYHSDKPLSYKHISNIVGKKEKSVRNLIYELRAKGTEIKDKPIGIRTKGFYLPREEKIKISGR